MRPLFLLLFGAISAFSQPFSVGVKGGMPLSDFVDTARNGSFSFTSNTNRYIVGGFAELRLPFKLAVEVDALYRHFSYTGIGTIGNIITTSRTTSGAWEFPVLGKYRFGSGPVRPFIDGGVSFNTLQGLTQTVASATNLSERSAAELDKSTVMGYVTGAGLEVKALFIRLTPEIRYTRWGARHFLDPNGLVKSNQNQAEVMVGISF